MAEQIPEDKIDLFATLAEYETLPAAIEKRYGGCADTVLLQIAAEEDIDRLVRLRRSDPAHPLSLRGIQPASQRCPEGKRR